MTGTYFEDDCAIVYQDIVLFSTRIPSENRIKIVAHHINGKLLMKVIRDHLSGEGNDTRRISEEERIRDILFYKNQKSLTVRIFLTKYDKIYNIFETYCEVME